MQNLESWINLAIWGMAILDWFLCGILAWAIALEKGHPRNKSLFFGLMGPFSLFRFLMEGFPLSKPAKVDAPDVPNMAAPSKPAEITYDHYRAHHRFQELMQLVAFDEGTAIRLINQQRNNHPNSSLDRWIDQAIYKLAQNEDAHQFQYRSEEYD